MQPQYIPEVNVIIAVVRWLHSEGWTIQSLSIPRGQGIDSVSSKNKVKTELAALGIEEKSVRFVPKGEDIRARKGSTLWRIECKSLGADLRSSTLRNQFDRGLASIVSYYDRSQGLQLGLALPEEYFKHIKGRLPQALRIAINLWVFIYVSADELIATLAPHEELS